MACHKLPNYVRLYRKRLGLSQQELAFLLGWRDGSHPSRYEYFSSIPRLRTALALAVIFRVSVHELFSGEYKKIESAVYRQAQRPKARLTTESPDQQTARKLGVLRTVVSVDANRS